MPLRRPAALRRRKMKAMAGPPMPSRMPKEWKPNLERFWTRCRETIRRVDGQSRMKDVFDIWLEW